MQTDVIRLTGMEQDAPVLERAGRIIRAGGLVAFPTETVYGLGGNGLDPAAAGRIYAAKGRPSDNPLILHITEREDLLPLTEEIPPAAEILMQAFWPGPMTLIFRKSALVPKETTGGLDTVAIRMPSHPGARAFIRAAGVPIAAPSANLSGRPSTTAADRVKEDMDGRIELILDGGPSDIGLESTIIDVTTETPTVLRPGFIGKKRLEQLFRKVDVDPAVYARPEEGFVPKAPGMKYRHYAPKASVTLVEGRPEAATAYIKQAAAEAAAAGRRTGILCSRETAPLYAGQEHVIVLGSREEDETVAHNLFQVLRELDDAGLEAVFSETFHDGPLGDAIMNRLRKAAGYQIVQAEEAEGEKNDSNRM